MDPPALSSQDLLALLAEEDRLRVVAAVVLGAVTAAEVAAATGLPARATARALARLTAGGLVERVQEPRERGRAAVPRSAGWSYRVRTEVLREAAAQAEPEPEIAGPEGEARAVLGRFVRGNRLVAIPAARSKRLLVLDHLAGLFEPGRRYPETEVNETLRAWYADYAALRRYLVDEGFLRRDDEWDPGGGRSLKVYWRTGGSFDLG
jgi:hypothetical protein